MLESAAAEAGNRPGRELVAQQVDRRVLVDSLAHVAACIRG